MNSITRVLLDDSLVPPPLQGAVMGAHAVEDSVGEEAMERALGNALASPDFAVLRGPPLGKETAPLGLLQHGKQGAEVQVEIKNRPHRRRLFRIDDDPPTLRIDVV